MQQLVRNNRARFNNQNNGAGLNIENVEDMELEDEQPPEQQQHQQLPEQQQNQQLPEQQQNQQPPEQQQNEDNENNDQENIRNRNNYDNQYERFNNRVRGMVKFLYIIPTEKISLIHNVNLDQKEMFK